MARNNVTVIGLQWGDEGKGKIVDALAATSRYVARYCGGANAGHTLNVAGQKYALHLIPCGLLHEDVLNVVGNGVAFDPETALKEIDALAQRGVRMSAENLCISSVAHCVMPWHKMQDRLSEESLGGAKIGTTVRGIGPCYSDKANRSTAVRVADLLDEQILADKVARIVEIKNPLFSAVYGSSETLDAAQITADYTAMGKRLAPMVGNAGAILRKATRQGKRVLFEGGQGSMLDIDHGTFPFVTSSSVTACGIPTGTSVSPKDIGTVVGLIKAYTTRVGAGPFPSEQDNDIGNYLRERGHEYGTTTGRPRRCGWFDAFAVRYAADISGVDELALSLLDVLSGLDELQVCTAYRVGETVLEDFDPAVMDRAECVYETLPGWNEDITGCKSFDELPPNAQAYVNRIEELIGRPVGFVSVGPDREATILHHTKISGLS